MYMYTYNIYKCHYIVYFEKQCNVTSSPEKELTATSYFHTIILTPQPYLRKHVNYTVAVNAS